MNSNKLNVINVLIHIGAIISSILCIIPFLLVISASFSSELDLAKYGFRLFPARVDLLAYEYLFTNPKIIINAYLVTIFTTAAGTFLSVLIMAMSAYALARKSFKYKRLLSFYIFFTMLFSGGLVPSYILITQYLHLRDNLLVLILPGLINAFHIIMLRTFFQKMPDALFESAKIDGASEYGILFRIAIPLAIPALAAITFLGAMGRWNEWYSALLYINDDRLAPLQYLLYRIMANVQYAMDAMKYAPSLDVNIQDIPGENLRMAMLIIAAGPMVMVFPFFQKHFVQGLTVGAVKG